MNTTFFTGDFTISFVWDDKGNYGLQTTGAIGFSPSTGVTVGGTATFAPTIYDLEGPGSTFGGALNAFGFFCEGNLVWNSWPHKLKNAYKGFDFGVGTGIGPSFVQFFTGITSTMWSGKKDKQIMPMFHFSPRHNTSN